MVLIDWFILGLILGLRPANESRRYFVMTSEMISHWLGTSLESTLYFKVCLDKPASIFFHLTSIKWMGYCKKDVTPLLTHWSYVFLALIHPRCIWFHNILWACIICYVYCANRHVAQIPQCTSFVSHNAPFCNRNVHISVTKWCIVGYLSTALWDLWDMGLFLQTGFNILYILCSFCLHIIVLVCCFTYLTCPNL